MVRAPLTRLLLKPSGSWRQKLHSSRVHTRALKFKGILESPSHPLVLIVFLHAGLSPSVCLSSIFTRCHHPIPLPICAPPRRNRHHWIRWRGGAPKLATRQPPRPALPNTSPSPTSACRPSRPTLERSCPWPLSLPGAALSHRSLSSTMPLPSRVVDPAPQGQSPSLPRSF